MFYRNDPVTEAIILSLRKIVTGPVREVHVLV